MLPQYGVLVTAHQMSSVCMWFCKVQGQVCNGGPLLWLALCVLLSNVATCENALGLFY